MNAFATIVEVVEVAVLVVLVIYLIRIIRGQEESEPRSAIIDRNLAELADFNRLVVSCPDLARIWQDGREDRRLNDIDQERFSLLATDYLSLLANQRLRAGEIADESLVEAATLKLIDTLQLNPGLLPEWEEIAHEVADADLREAVNKAMNPAEAEPESGPDSTADTAPSSDAAQPEKPAAAATTVSQAATLEEAAEQAPAKVTIAKEASTSGTEPEAEPGQPQQSAATDEEQQEPATDPAPLKIESAQPSPARTDDSQLQTAAAADQDSQIREQSSASEAHQDKPSLGAVPAKAS